MKNNKILLPTIIAVATLVLLTFGATYAYFTVTGTNSFGTRVIEGSTPAVGSVLLSTGSNLYLHLSRTDMTQTAAGASGKTYYAVTSTAGTPSTDSSAKTIGTATVTGEGTFTCTFNLKVAISGTMKAALSAKGTAILNVNGKDYDIYDTTFPLTIPVSMTGLKSGSPQNVTATFRFVNTASNQDALKDKSITLTFTAETLSCSVTA